MTFMPEEGFSDPALAPPPRPDSVPEFDTFPARPQQDVIAPPPQTRTRRTAWILGAVGAVAAVLVISGVYSMVDRSSPGPSGVYSGAPVEASDALDGVTMVGLNDTVAYVPDPQWQEVTEYFEFEGATGPPSVADDVVGVHTFDAPDGRGVFVVVLAHRGPAGVSPTDRFAAILTEVYAIDVSDFAGSVQQVETAQGLEGAVGLRDVPYLEERFYTRFAILGRGENVAIVEWITVGAPADEATFQRLVDSVRVDE